MTRLAGIGLRRGRENSRHIAAVAARSGERVGLAGVLDDLNRHACPARVPGRAVQAGFTWNEQDVESELWWPQGISTSADASDTEDVHGRSVLMTTWYCKNVPEGRQGSRITVVDLDTLRYRHVLLVRAFAAPWGPPVLCPVLIHAGGVVWAGEYVHVAATGRGLFTCRLDDIIRVEPTSRTFGYRYVLPVGFRYRAAAARGHEGLRYSFLSLDRSTHPPELVAGEYGQGEMSTRLAHYRLDPDSLLLESTDGEYAQPAVVGDAGVGHMQGAVVVDGRYYISASRGRRTAGRLYAGAPGDLVRHDDALPAGPEDITYWSSRDQLWSLSEYPSQRYVFCMDRSRFD